MPIRPARVGRVGVIGAPGAENGGGGEGRYAWAGAGCQNCSGRRGRNTGSGAAPKSNQMLVGTQPRTSSLLCPCPSLRAATFRAGAGNPRTRRLRRVAFSLLHRRFLPALRVMPGRPRQIGKAPSPPEPTKAVVPSFTTVRIRATAKLARAGGLTPMERNRRKTRPLQ